MLGAPTSRAARAAAVAALIAATGMVSAYQANQNTYLLHAVVRADGGSLRGDRLARAPDPTPVFTLIASSALKVAGTAAGYVGWLLAAAVFYTTLVWAVSSVLRSGAALAAWTAAMAVLAGPLVGDVLSGTIGGHLGGLTAPGAFLGGVAEQYALGQYLQPSAAGVLLVAGTVFAVRRSDAWWAVAAVFAAGIVHPTYLVTAWVLAGGLALARAAELAGWRDRVLVLLRTGGVALAASVPGALANLAPLRAARGPGAAAASEILADHRLPHHANPGQWFEPATALVLVAVVGILLLARRRGDAPTRQLAAALLGVTVVSIALSALVVVSGDPGLRLLFPWRASIVVVPLTAAIGIALAVGHLADPEEGPSLGRLGALVVAAALAAAGLARTFDSLQHPVRDDGAVAAVLAHPPRGEGIVPTDQEDLRLNGGHPIYVDVKNHPFAPAAVISWWTRVADAQQAEHDPAMLCRLIEREHAGWAVATPSVAPTVARTCLRGWQQWDAGGGARYFIRPQR